jgi:molybdate transport system permease protein
VSSSPPDTATPPLPGPIKALAALGAALVSLPLVGLLVRAPWSSLLERLGDDIVIDALRVSITSSLAATAFVVVLGVPLGWTLARTDFAGRQVVRAVVLLPIVLPPVVGGAALLFALGRSGVVGKPLNDAVGLVLPFSFWGVVVANAFVALPFMVLTVEGAVRALNPRVELAAATLGATPVTVFLRVGLPLIGPSIVAGTVLAWARAFGEFGATITFAGNLQGRTQTMPLAVFVALETDRDTAVALSLLMVAVSMTVLVALRDRWWTS